MERAARRDEPGGAAARCWWSTCRATRAEQARRHDVLPGITGWAQVNGRNALDWDERFRLDVWYVDHWSLALDARILALTFLRVAQRQGISYEGAATMFKFLGNRGEASVRPSSWGTARTTSTTRASSSGVRLEPDGRHSPLLEQRLRHIAAAPLEARRRPAAGASASRRAAPRCSPAPAPAAPPRGPRRTRAGSIGQARQPARVPPPGRLGHEGRCPALPARACRIEAKFLRRAATRSSSTWSCPRPIAASTLLSR